MSLVRLLVRRRGWVGLAWLAVAVLLLPEARHVSDRLEAAARVDGSESKAVEALLAGPLASAYARFAVLVVGGVPAPTSPEGEAVLREVTEALRQAPEVAGTYSWLDSKDTLFLGSEEGGTFIVAGLTGDGRSPDRLVPALRQRTVELETRLRAGRPGLTLRWTGEGPLNVDLRRTSGHDVAMAERRALPVTGVLLLLAFGSVTATLLPLGAGTLAIAAALGAAAMVARHWPLSILLQSVVSMLGLGLGIDYALLMVSRFREARASGAPPVVAAETAGVHAGHTILLSAGTVVIGFLALLLVPLNELRAVAVGGLLVVASSALLATTLLPGALAWLGPRLDWGRVRRVGPSADRSADGWRRLGRLVTAHPWLALGLGATPLVLLSFQARHLRTGFPRGEWLPHSMESSIAIDDLREMGRGGAVQVVRIVVQLPESVSVRRSAGWRALSAYVDSLASDQRVERVRSVITVARAAGMGRSALAFLPDSMTHGLVSADGRLGLVEVLPAESLSVDALVGFVREIRRRGAEATGVAGARVLVGGLPAFNADYQDAVTGRFRQLVTLVVAGTLLALFLGVRSILVPIKAVALNLLSVGAAFGALTLVFQDGYGGTWLGVSQRLGAVFSTLPVVVFCIVFGLSMDYEVFLVTRVMEARQAGFDDRLAIVEALGTTGQVITNAAMIMLAVFAAFTGGDFLMIKMLGFTLAAAVLFDATLVRMIIGPALLQLAGQWNWWPGRGAARSPLESGAEGELLGEPDSGMAAGPR